MKNNRRIQKYTLIQQQLKRWGEGHSGSQEEKNLLYSRMPSNKYGKVDRIEKITIL